jgi:hypothetical protein
MAKKVLKKAAKSKQRGQGNVVKWLHVEEEIIIAGGGLVVIVMIFIFLF